MTHRATHRQALEAPPPDTITRDVWLLAAAIVAGLAMVLLDTTIVNVAMDSISDQLHASLRAVQWVSDRVPAFFAGAALYGALLIAPLYYQVARGQSPLVAGLLIAPQGLGAAIAMRPAGRQTDRRGGGAVASVGLVICTVATIPLAFVGAHTSFAWLAVVLLIRGLGIGASLTPITAAAYTTLRPEEIPRATSTISVLQQLGGSIGVTLLAVTLQSQLDGARHADDRQPPALVAHAFAHTFTWALVLTAVALSAAVVLARTTRNRARS